MAAAREDEDPWLPTVSAIYAKLLEMGMDTSMATEIQNLLKTEDAEALFKSRDSEGGEEEMKISSDEEDIEGASVGATPPGAEAELAERRTTDAADRSSPAKPKDRVKPLEEEEELEERRTKDAVDRSSPAKPAVRLKSLEDRYRCTQ